MLPLPPSESSTENWWDKPPVSCSDGERDSIIFHMFLFWQELEVMGPRGSRISRCFNGCFQEEIPPTVSNGEVQERDLETMRRSEMLEAGDFRCGLRWECSGINPINAPKLIKLRRFLEHFDQGCVTLGHLFLRFIYLQVCVQSLAMMQLCFSAGAALIFAHKLLDCAEMADKLHNVCGYHTT